ncbi:hypothetical protein Elgi_59260 [Paenibacillus elgii]|uniref:hypothetical protein n=1 Tax=Paenibacillus elgii TaxID=189691 RepID=UPI002D7C1971|nr:hypothetical protein Elgi_59260 [Paenibacillus elgii]
MKINLRNQVGIVKERKVGFSWTTLFFGFFPVLFRGDWKWAIIQFVAAGCTLHINDLLKNGYEPSDENSRTVLVSKGFITGNRTFTA